MGELKVDLAFEIHALAVLCAVEKADDKEGILRHSHKHGIDRGCLKFAQIILLQIVDC